MASQISSIMADIALQAPMTINFVCFRSNPTTHEMVNFRYLISHIMMYHANVPDVPCKKLVCELIIHLFFDFFLNVGVAYLYALIS